MAKFADRIKKKKERNENRTWDVYTKPEENGSGTSGYQGYTQSSSVYPAGIGEMPIYNTEYMQNSKALADKLRDMDYAGWTNGDQYKSLQNRYSASGRMGMQDVMGQVAARTGGLASSYATSAAQQQYNYYMSQLEDVARQMYAQERDDILQNANLYRNLAIDEYGRYRDEMSDYNARYAAMQAASRSSNKGEQTDRNFKLRKPDPSRYYTKRSENLVNVPNYGEVSYEDAETLEKKGYIKLIGVDKNGKPVFSPTTRKNYVDPVKLTR